MSIEITLIRHAETDGNSGHVWQGQGDSPLTPLGGEQAADLGRRLAGEGFHRVVSSDLGRVLETAARAGLDPEPDPAWREVDIGRWEGLTRAQVAERYPDELSALVRGEELPVGGGETWHGFGERADRALADLAASMADGERALVVAHGGVIGALVAAHLGFRGERRPWPVDRIRNTALTRFRIEGSEVSLTLFNDASHTRVRPHPFETGPVAALIRHGETEANVSGRWQGITDGPLTDRGRHQVRRLAAACDGIAHVFSSHLQRARDTGSVLAAAAGAGLTVRDDLHEISFGAWEDLTPEEVAARFPRDWQSIFVESNDLPRGGDGETMASAAERLAQAVAEIVSGREDGRVAVVSHGGVIRGYVASVVGLTFATRRRLALPANAAVSHVRFDEGGPVLADYNLQPGA